MKSCFVVMPIGDRSTDRGQHFLGVYRTLHQVISGKGFAVRRADDLKHDGSINRDIVLEISNADLVVGDLTDANPNVFYELGIRHTLRRQGTLLLQDVTRTLDIPFDLSSYRVLRYEGTIPGLGKLADELEASIDAIGQDDSLSGGNPVHDWIPELPADLVAAASGEVETALRLEISELRAEVTGYRSRYGLEGAREKRTLGDDPRVLLAKTEALLNRARRGLVGTLLVARAREAVEARDVESMLEIGVDAFKERVHVSSREALQLSQLAGLVGLGELATAWLDFGLVFAPEDKGLTQARLAKLCHSELAEERELGRQSILDQLDIDVEQMTMGRRPFNDKLSLAALGFFFDAARRDDMHEESLEMLQMLEKQFPDRSMPKMHLGRCLGDLGRYDESLKAARAAIEQPDIRDDAPIWLGNDLHNHGYHVSALEAYLVAASLDIDDANVWAHIAEEISFALHEPWTLRSGNVFEGSLEFRDPEGLEDSHSLSAAAIALRLAGLNPESLGRLERTVTRLGRRSELMVELASGAPPSASERRVLCADLYALVASPLTEGVPEQGRPDGKVAKVPAAVRMVNLRDVEDPAL